MRVSEAGPLPPEAAKKTSAEMDSSINSPMSSRMMADSAFCVRSNESRCGLDAQRLTAAHDSTARKPTARSSRYIANALTPVFVSRVDDSLGHAESP